MRIEIVDADRRLPAGMEGIIRIASEFGIEGYLDDPIESAAVFRQGWFYPGDLGSLTSGHLLVSGGRRNDVLYAGGDKIAAEMVAAVLLAHKGVREGRVHEDSTSGVEEVWAAIVTSEAVDAEALHTHCAAHMPHVFVPAHVVPMDRLPVNAAGKVDRPRLKQMLAKPNS